MGGVTHATTTKRRPQNSGQAYTAPWQTTCDCGWRSRYVTSREGALDAADAHKAAL